MSTTIPDGVTAARARQARLEVARRLHVSADEATYMIAWMRYRAGIIQRPRAWVPNHAWLEAEVDRYLTLIDAGDDPEVDEA